MRTEILMLGLAIILGICHLLLAAMAGTQQRGLKWNMSSRDEVVSALNGKAARLDRAFKNFLETFPFFVGAIFIAVAASESSSQAAIGSQMYVLARILYIPAYLFNIIGLRSVLWLVSIIGIGLVLLSGLQLL